MSKDLRERSVVVARVACQEHLVSCATPRTRGSLRSRELREGSSPDFWQGRAQSLCFFIEMLPPAPSPLREESENCKYGANASGEKTQPDKSGKRHAIG